VAKLRVRNLISGQVTEMKRNQREIIELEKGCRKINPDLASDLEYELNEDVLSLQSTLQEFFQKIATEKQYLTALLAFLKLDLAQQYSII
jgi:hypothetical protein